MNEQPIRRAVRDVSDTDAPSFESVIGGNAKRRLRKLRLGAAFLLIIVCATATFALRRPAREPEIAMLELPTTDWLLQTSDPAWVAQLNHNTNQEPSNVR